MFVSTPTPPIPFNSYSYDSVFIPDEGDGRTFGEMTDDEKNDISHRARAFRALGEWLQALR